VEIALLGLRLVVGLGFAAHGAQKLFGAFGAFGGHGIDGTAGIFEQIGLRPGKLHARAAGTAELLGGLLIALAS
jgi:putative oxidoreductase